MGVEQMKASELVRVIVRSDDLFYSCQIFPSKVKCGRCGVGLINPFAIRGYGSSCKKCKAELYETVTGYGKDAQSYHP